MREYIASPGVVDPKLGNMLLVSGRSAVRIRSPAPVQKPYRAIRAPRGEADREPQSYAPRYDGVHTVPSRPRRGCDLLRCGEVPVRRCRLDRVRPGREAAPAQGHWPHQARTCGTCSRRCQLLDAHAWLAYLPGTVVGLQPQLRHRQGDEHRELQAQLVSRPVPAGPRGGHYRAFSPFLHLAGPAYPCGRHEWSLPALPRLPVASLILSSHPRIPALEAGFRPRSELRPSGMRGHRANLLTDVALGRRRETDSLSAVGASVLRTSAGRL